MSAWSLDRKEYHMSGIAELPLTHSWNEESALLERAIRSAKCDCPLRIMEAGCGQRWDIDIADIDYHLTGVDLDAAALRMRLELVGDLHEAVEGDLRSVEFADSSFDVIYNSYVLEHVAGAEKVLDNFVRWLRPGGIVLLRIPDPYSVHGFMSRATPHWFHVWYFRHVLKRPNAGRPGHAPYPVQYDEVVSRPGIKAYCRDNGLTLLAEYGTGGFVEPGSGIQRQLIGAFKRLAVLLSLGRLTSRHRDLLFILRKQ